MLCEFTWSDNNTYIGIIQQHPYIPHEKHKEISEQDFEDEFALLTNIFGANAFLPSSRFDRDRIWLRENLHQTDKFDAYIWYPADINTRVDAFEKVRIQRAESKFDIKITAIEEGVEEEEVINYSKISKNDFFSAGLCILDETKLKDSYKLDLSAKLDFNDEISRKLSQVDRVVTERHIHYLDKLLPLEPLIYYEERLGLDKLHPLIKHFLQEERIELWNAFVVAVESNKLAPAQILHRDSYYDSLSLFFYLDVPCDPGTFFWPFTHRLTGAIKEGLVSEFCPTLKVGNILVMHGRMLHQGCASTVLQARKRMLYVFSYRSRMPRSQRAKLVEATKNALEAGGDAGTVFKVG